MTDTRPDFWKPWWIAYAEFDGVGVILHDDTVPDVTRSKFYVCRRYDKPPGCINASYIGDDLDEARAAFERACEEMLVTA